MNSGPVIRIEYFYHLLDLLPELILTRLSMHIISLSMAVIRIIHV